MTLTVIDLVKYYKQNNIHDYPKTKKGQPDMRKQYNKQMLQTLQKNIKQEIRQKQENEIFKNNVRKIINEEKQTECIICCDKIHNNIAFLSCGHQFCVKCIMMHSRENNNCPVCRKELCPKLIKKDKMPNQIMANIVTTELNMLRTERMDMNLNNFIKMKMVDIIKIIAPEYPINFNNDTEIMNILKEITDEIENTGVDIGVNIDNWYQS